MGIKHVKIDQHFSEEKIDSKQVEAKHIPASMQILDIFNKSIAKPKFENLMSKLGMIDIYSPAWGEVLYTICLDMISLFI